MHKNAKNKCIWHPTPPCNDPTVASANLFFFACDRRKKNSAERSQSRSRVSNRPGFGLTDLGGREHCSSQLGKKGGGGASSSCFQPIPCPPPYHNRVPCPLAHEARPAHTDVPTQSKAPASDSGALPCTFRSLLHQLRIDTRAPLKPQLLRLIVDQVDHRKTCSQSTKHAARTCGTKRTARATGHRALHIPMAQRSCAVPCCVRSNGVRAYMKRGGGPQADQNEHDTCTSWCVYAFLCVPALGMCSSPQEGLQSRGAHGHWVQNPPPLSYTFWAK